MIRANTLIGYFQVARRHGLNPLGLLESAGIEASLIGNPDQRIPVSAACALLEMSAERSKCHTFGLEMAELRSRRDVGAIGLSLAHARTLRDALLTAERYSHLLNDALGLHIEPSGELVTIREEIITDAPFQARQATELAMGVLTRICRALLNPNWHPRGVCFTHPAPADISFHRRFFGCSVTFGGEYNGIVCAAADLDFPNPAADPELARYVEGLSAPWNGLDAKSIVLEVRRAIYLLLPLGQATVEDVACSLHLSTRTLQRKLCEADTEFTSLLSDVRSNLAVRYLSNATFPLGRISALLGYSRQASFTRWFISRFGRPPSAWRK